MHIFKQKSCLAPELYLNANIYIYIYIYIYVTVCCLAGRTHTRTHVGEGLDNRMRATMFFIRYSSDLYIFTILQNTEIKLVLQSHFNMKCFVHITQQTHTANSNISWRLWLSPGQLIK